MTLFDLVRVLVFSTFGVGVGFMVLTNCIAFIVLRPPKAMGFLWWHVASISLSFLCLGSVGTWFVASRFGDPPGLASLVVLVGTILFAIAQILIFRVERGRLIFARAAKKADYRDVRA